MSMYFDFENADAFATGAIGEPGQRTFYLQVRAEGRVVSVKCEKSQVQALSTYLRDMLADMPDTGPALDPTKSSLVNPVEQDFVLGSIGLGVDRTNMRMVVQLEEMVMVDEEEDDIFDFSSGYIQRGKHMMPRNAATLPWRLNQDYRKDKQDMRQAPLDDGVMQFRRVRQPVDA